MRKVVLSTKLFAEVVSTTKLFAEACVKDKNFKKLDLAPDTYISFLSVGYLFMQIFF